MIETAAFRVWWDDDARVARVEWLPGSRGDLATVKAVTAAILRLARGPVPLLVDIRHMAAFEREARAHLLDDYGGASRVALLAGSAVNRMVANFFIGMKRLPVPIRMFTDRTEAITWLREQQ